MKFKRNTILKKNRWTLYRKLVAAVFFSMFISLVFGISTLLIISYQTLLGMNDNLIKNNLVGVKSNIGQLIASIENEVTVTLLNKDFRISIMDGEKTFEDADFYTTTNTQAVVSMIRMPYVVNIAVLKTNGSSYYAITPKYELAFLDYQDCQARLSEGQNKIVNWHGIAGWYGPIKNTTTTGKPTECLLHVREILDINKVQPQAVMLFYLDEPSLCSLYGFFGSESFMVDHNGTIVSAVNKTLLGTSIAEKEIFQKILTSGNQPVSGSYREGAEQKPFYGIYLPSLDSYIVTVPDFRLFTIVQKAVYIDTLYLLLIGTVLSFFFADLLARRLTGPIARLKSAMLKARNGNLKIRYEGDEGDEIGYLGTTFNILMNTIEQDIQDIHIREEEKRTHELRLLQAQINPHLLYNTLDSALYLLSKNEVGQTYEAIEALSEFFKLSLSKGKMFVPIETEIAQVQQYMKIQRLCRGKRISLEIASKPEFLKDEIIKMTLQPIVENCYLHAFTETSATGEIYIEILEENGTKHISVTDDGIGMDEHELAEVREMLAESKESRQGFGLWNVNQRLKNYYGEAYGLAIDSEFGEYTRVTVTVPGRQDVLDV